MDNGVEGIDVPRASAMDGAQAVMLAEGAVAQVIFEALPGAGLSAGRNVFGDPVRVEQGADGTVLITRAADLAAQGIRVAVLLETRALAAAREALVAAVERRLGFVVHAFGAASDGVALALSDLPVGQLWSGGVLESFDLTLIARRAAEDSGTVFLVVHERGAVRVTEPLAPPPPGLCEGYIGPTPPAPAPRTAGSTHGVSARTFAERVPFALGSAMRGLEALTGRRCDVFERIPGGDTGLVLVGLGALGEPLLAEVERLRAAGVDVGAVKLTALRPFPGPRLVKALARSFGVSVVEGADVPLAACNPLAREIKAAFADALTWAPDYPGVGRMPRFFAGVVTPGTELDSSDVDALAHNMTADDRGRRFFVLGRDEAHGLPRVTPARATTAPMAFRGLVATETAACIGADMCSALVARVLGLRVRASVRRLGTEDGGGFAFDLVAARDRARGAHVPHAFRILALQGGGALNQGNPLARLAQRGTLAVAVPEGGTAEELWAGLPPYARALAHDRRVRVVGWALPPGGAGPTAGVTPGGPDDGAWVLAAAFAALAVSGASHEGRAALDGEAFAREIFRLVTGTLGQVRESLATLAAQTGKAALTRTGLEVPRALIDRDDETARLGRRDARASVPPR